MPSRKEFKLVNKIAKKHKRFLLLVYDEKKDDIEIIGYKLYKNPPSYYFLQHTIDSPKDWFLKIRQQYVDKIVTKRYTTSSLE